MSVVVDNALPAYFKLEARYGGRKDLILLRDVFRPNQPSQNDGLRLLAEFDLSGRFDYEHSIWQHLNYLSPECCAQTRVGGAGALRVEPRRRRLIYQIL